MSFISYHNIFSNFLGRVIADGGSLSQDEITALNHWCWENDKNGFLSSYIAYYPFVGGTGTTQSIANFRHNLISSSFKLTANNITASMCTSKGYQGNGTNSYWDTGLNPNTVLNSNSNGMSIYSRTFSIASKFEMGCVGLGASSRSVIAVAVIINGLSSPSNGNYLELGIQSSFSSSTLHEVIIALNRQSFISISRNSSISLLGYTNGNLIGSDTFTSTALPSPNIYIGCVNNNNVASQFSVNQFVAPAIFNTSFNAAQELIRWKIEQNTQTYLNRQINF